MPTILIVDDEPLMRQGLADNLQFEGYSVVEAANGVEALERLHDTHVDLILLDVMMPQLSGLDVCRRLRAEGNHTPIIFLTARSEEIDKVLGLELGADDYITKPFGLRETLARVKALLRRSEPGGAGVVRVGRVEMDLAHRRVRRDGLDLEMTTREMDILFYLHEKRGTVVERDELLTTVWGYDEAPTSRTVDNFILRLRQKIEPDPAHPRHILTVHGMGYKLLP